MTGHRAELAKTTVREILDTLGNNDYVNVFKFSDSTEGVVPCFKEGLVPASLENKREMKNALDAIRPENIANFTSGLVTAFELLHKVGIRAEKNDKPMFRARSFIFSIIELVKAHSVIKVSC